MATLCVRIHGLSIAMAASIRGRGQESAPTAVALKPAAAILSPARVEVVTGKRG